MFNFCLLSGIVITEPTLRCNRKGDPLTEFTIEIWMRNYRGGIIQVNCLGRLAVGVVKHLAIGDRIAAAGFLTRDINREDNETYMNELRLAATELEVLRKVPDIEAEPFGEDPPN